MRNLIDVLETPSKNCIQLVFDKEVIRGGVMEIKNGGVCSIAPIKEIFKSHPIIKSLSFIENKIILCLDLISEAYKHKNIKEIISTIVEANTPTLYEEQNLSRKLNKLLVQAKEDGGGFYIENNEIITIGACSECLGRQALIDYIEQAR